MNSGKTAQMNNVNMKRCGAHSLEVEEGGFGEEVLIDEKYLFIKFHQ